jgi:hypothetical protein
MVLQEVNDWWCIVSVMSEHPTFDHFGYTLNHLQYTRCSKRNQEVFSKKTRRSNGSPGTDKAQAAFLEALDEEKSEFAKVFSARMIALARSGRGLLWRWLSR